MAHSEPRQTSKMERFAKDIKDVMKMLNRGTLLKCKTNCNRIKNCHRPHKHKHININTTTFTGRQKCQDLIYVKSKSRIGTLTYLKLS